MHFDLGRLQSVATYVYLLGYAIPLAVTSVLALRRGDTSLGVLLGIFACTAALMLWRVYLVGLQLSTRIAIVAAICLMYSYLVIGGGYANTGLLWCYAVVVVIYHFSTALLGLLLNLALVTGAGIVLLTPAFAEAVPDYGAAMVNRFLVTSTITSILFFLYALLQEALKARLREVQEELLRASTTDELTGLTNRRSMKEALQHAERRDLRNRMLAVMIADVDHFKRINDSLGHDAGDQILQHIAQALRRSLRDSDRVARWGGEEFLVLLDVLNEEEARQVAERMRTSLEAAPLEYAGERVLATASFGVKVVADPSVRLEDAVIAADINLLKAKELGRNRVIVS